MIIFLVFQENLIYKYYEGLESHSHISSVIYLAAFKKTTQHVLLETHC